MKWLVLTCLLLTGCGVQDIDLARRDGNVVLLDGLPTNTPRRFAVAAAEETREPMLALRYPDEGAALPSNFAPLTFAWNDTKKMPGKEPALPRVYELALTTGASSLRIYTTQSNTTVPAQHWLQLLADQQGRDLTVSLSSVDADDRVRTGKVLTLPLRSALPERDLYFWSELEPALERVSLPRGTVELVASARDVACAGCWALSSEGEHLLQIDEGGALRLRSLRDGALSSIPGVVDPNTVDSCVVDRAAQYAVVNGAVSSTWLQAPSSAQMPLDVANLRGFALAPVGEHVAYVRAEQAAMPMAMSTVRLEQARLSTAGELSEATLLAHSEKADEGIAHPAYDAEGSLIAFERTKGPEGRDSALAIVTSADGKITTLDKGSKRDAWPTFLPASSDDELWLVFSSGRDGPVAKAGAGQTQLWLWNIQRASDGSLHPADAPVWLEFQAPDDVLSRPQWGL